MRLIVCGGRAFCDVPRLWAILDGIDERDIAKGGEGIRLLIDGGQKHELSGERGTVGADYWAHQWALARNRPTLQFHADWDGEGRSAGPKHNARMADESKATHGLAMPGNRGTANMVENMRRAGIIVRDERFK